MCIKNVSFFSLSSKSTLTLAFIKGLEWAKLHINGKKIFGLIIFLIIDFLHTITIKSNYFDEEFIKRQKKKKN
ncbi:hypothetical protein BpHYR1_048362 [Brachionus plicatilis]|uniref:Uncharacterized protein n=1 Tax=Brachionus plicatilis TaxID=10195 RepID=A0A3M7QKN9_BRAPC|nr:hypothetical protein BpHYR1_048362 [Brachionus plicatilis]